MIMILTEKNHGGFLMDLKSKQNWLTFLDLWGKSGLTKMDLCNSKKSHLQSFTIMPKDIEIYLSNRQSQLSPAPSNPYSFHLPAKSFAFFGSVREEIM